LTPCFVLKHVTPFSNHLTLPMSEGRGFSGVLLDNLHVAFKLPPQNQILSKNISLHKKTKLFHLLLAQGTKSNYFPLKL
ncbi:MAG: hypothetical protein M0R03_22085, partial [Novosphingobium sp.]|nr:hypothetical protein [Novosphingobium sp.]